MAKRPATRAAGSTPAASPSAADLAAAQVEVDRGAAKEAADDGAIADAIPDGVIADPAELGGFDMAGRTLLVRSVSPLGRRRAGMAFGPVPAPVAVDDLGEDQLAAILGDTGHLIIVLDH